MPIYAMRMRVSDIAMGVVAGQRDRDADYLNLLTVS